MSGRRSRHAAVVAALAIVAAAGPLGGQTLVPSTPALRGGDVGLVHLEARPGSPAVALVLTLPVGSAEDPPGLEGTARLLAGAIARTVSDGVGEAGVITDVDVAPHRTRVQALALVDRWEEAWRALHAAAFGAGPSDEAVAAEKAALEESLRFNAGAPILDVQRETRFLLYGAGSPEGRPPEGTLEGTGAAGPSDLDVFRRARYQADAAALALVGRFDMAAARSALGIPEETRPPATDTTGAALPEAAPDTVAAAAADTARAAREGVEAATPTPAEGAEARSWRGERPWETGDRVRIAPEVTSTWIAAAYPAPADLPVTLLDALAQRLGEVLNPTPADPGLFSARVRVVSVPRGRALLIEVAVLPDAAGRWETRILDAVTALATPPQPDFFRWQRRRFRSEALTREAAPEEAASRHADDLLETAAVRDLAGTLWVLDAASMAAAAASLGPPRILVYGPDLAGG